MVTVTKTAGSIGEAPARPDKTAPETLPLDSVRTGLAWVWLAGAGLVASVMALQSLLGRYGTLTQDAWGWILPTIMPTLLMIITVLSYTALDPVSSSSLVRKTFFRIAMVLSIAYLVQIAMVVLIAPFAAKDAKEMVGLMHTSNLWLGPFQGLVAAALGVLFVTKQTKHGAPGT